MQRDNASAAVSVLCITTIQHAGDWFAAQRSKCFTPELNIILLLVRFVGRDSHGFRWHHFFCRFRQNKSSKIVCVCLAGGRSRFCWCCEFEVGQKLVSASLVQIHYRIIIITLFKTNYTRISAMRRLNLLDECNGYNFDFPYSTVLHSLVRKALQTLKLLRLAAE